MKKWIALLLALMMVLSMAACGAKEETPAPDNNAETDVSEVVEDEVEEPAAEPAPFDLQLAMDVITYMYTPDFESVFNMMHPAIVAQTSAEDLAVMIEEGNASVQAELDGFVETYGEVELVFTAEEAFPIEDYYELVADYINCSITVNGYMEVPVTITESASGEEVGQYVLYFVEADGQWYLDNFA